MMHRHRFRWFFPLALVGAAITAFGAAGCHHHRHDPAHRAEWVTKKIASELDLNDAQKAKLEAVKLEFLAVHERNKKQRLETLDFALTQIRAKELDTAKIQQMLEQRHKQWIDAAPSVLKKAAEFHASLTDEQRETAARKLEKFRDYLDN